MVPEDGFHELLMGNVGRIVAVHGDLLQDDVTLLLELFRVEDGRGHHVGDHVDGHGEVGVEDPGVVAGIFLRRRSV